MLVQNSTPPQFHELNLCVSKRLRWLFWVANGLAPLAIFVSGAPFWLKGLAVILILLAGWRHWRRDLAENGPERIVALRWRETLFQVRFNHSVGWCDAQLLSGSRYWPGWLVLRLETAEEGNRQLILPGDVGDKDVLRRLQILLQQQKPERSGD